MWVQGGAGPLGLCSVGGRKEAGSNNIARACVLTVRPGVARMVFR